MLAVRVVDPYVVSGLGKTAMAEVPKCSTPPERAFRSPVIIFPV